MPEEPELTIRVRFTTVLPFISAASLLNMNGENCDCIFAGLVISFSSHDFKQIVKTDSFRSRAKAACQVEQSFSCV